MTYFRNSKPAPQPSASVEMELLNDSDLQQISGGLISIPDVVAGAGGAVGGAILGGVATGGHPLGVIIGGYLGAIGGVAASQAVGAAIDGA
jgi:RNA-splicing ligase RtcB